jgi:ABC-type Mn2+/Zn2+ transport system permease subunit
MWTRLIEFWTLRYDFLGSMMVGSALVGVSCGLLGTFLVLRRLSLMGDALGHASLPGIALAFWWAREKALAPLLTGAAATALLAAVLVGALPRHSRTRPDAALGLVMASFFGLGTALMSHLQQLPGLSNSGLEDFLLGNAAAISPPEVWALGALAALTLAWVIALYRPLALSTFDPTLARAMGLPADAIHLSLMALSALAVVLSIQSVGVILVAAMLITPPSTARLLTDRLPGVLALSALFGALSGVLGAMCSYLWAGFSSGPSMVLIAALLYALAFALAPRRGLLPRWWRRRRLIAAHAQEAI